MIFAWNNQHWRAEHNFINISHCLYSSTNSYDMLCWYSSTSQTMRMSKLDYFIAFGNSRVGDKSYIIFHTHHFFAINSIHVICGINLFFFFFELLPFDLFLWKPTRDINYGWRFTVWNILRFQLCHFSNRCCFSFLDNKVHSTIWCFGVRSNFGSFLCE